MDINKKNVGELVTEDYRTAAVFKKYGIDYCCQSNRTVEDACERKHADVQQVVSEIQTVQQSPQQGQSIAGECKNWPLDLLADYIEKKHHRYVEKQIPVLTANLHKLSKVHGDKHPELMEIKELFDGCAGELTSHMKKEELMLFPYIRKMVTQGAQMDFTPPFGTVQNPVKAMMHEHDTEGERFRKIEELSGAYTPPADACNTYRVTYALLKEFEDDLHEHIHLENNILFPKAIELEQRLRN